MRSIYRGEWRQGLMHGCGVQLKRDGDGHFSSLVGAEDWLIHTYSNIGTHDGEATPLFRVGFTSGEMGGEEFLLLGRAFS